MLRQLAAAWLGVIAAERRCTNPPSATVQVASADAFRDSIGVNTHLQYGETAYADPERVDRALAYLGIVHLRDSALRRGPSGFEHYVNLGRRGYRFDLFFDADLKTQLQRVAALEADAPGSLASIEGPNEVNNDPISYGGYEGVQGAQAYQAALYSVVKGTPKLHSLTVLNYTNYPASSGHADAVNVHTYAKLGASAEPRLSQDDDAIAAAMPAGLPFYITETGYMTPPPAASPDAVSLNEQAQLSVVALLDGFQRGAKRIYLYELLDERADRTAHVDPEHHYGLFDVEGRPKPAAIAMRALLKLVSGPGSASRSLISDVVVSGSGVRHLVLTTRDAELLFLWRESSPGDRPGKAEIRLEQPCVVHQLSLSDAQQSTAVKEQQWSVELGRGPTVFSLRPSPQAEPKTLPLAPSSLPRAMLR